MSERGRQEEVISSVDFIEADLRRRAPVCKETWVPTFLLSVATMENDCAAICALSVFCL
jgi:hypothetical protein